MELRTLRYFVAVLEAGSLTKAAQSLYVAQPALSAQIKKLEEDLDVILFERSYAGVVPTTAGMQLYQDARKLLFDAEAMKERMQTLPKEPEGSVTLAIPFLLASLVLGSMLARLKKEYPKIRVFVLDDLSLMVKKTILDRRAEIGILVDDDQKINGFKSIPLAKEAIYFCGLDSNKQLKQYLSYSSNRKYPEIQLKDALCQPLILQSKRYSIRERIEKRAFELGITLDIRHEQDSARVIRSLYLAEAGFAFTPASAIENTKKHDDLMIAQVTQPEVFRHYYLVLPDLEELNPVQKIVYQFLVNEIGMLIDQGLWTAEFLYS